MKQVTQTEFDTLVYSDDFENAACVIAKCCRPIPAMRIVGVVTKRRIISVHSNDCRQALKLKDRWEKVNWKEQYNKALKVIVEANERSGLLADILHTIANARFEVREAKAKLINNNCSECSFVIIPQSLSRVIELIERVMKVKGVKKVYFD
mgnify:CR=1 FL=1